MKLTERVGENLNGALHALFANDPDVFLIGEDILDPYGGAFKISKGLSARYPDRVLTTPISEGAIIGIAGGLALSGHKPIVEIMFGDFLALGFDQILNFATKSVAMYGQRLGMHLVIRCPVGGNRSYGPTHSQSLQKHFIGIPYLSLFEMTPFHDNTRLLKKLINLGHPCLLFEDKILYTRPMYTDGVIDDLFVFDFLGNENEIARIVPDGVDNYDCLIIAPGGMVTRCLEAARTLLIEDEIGVQVLVPSQLYPVALTPALGLIAESPRLLIVEEGVAGGTWGSEVATQLYQTLWGRLQCPIQLVHSQPTIIPSSCQLEQQVLVQSADIVQAIRRGVSGAYVSGAQNQ